jgi:hypothetical protein
VTGGGFSDVERCGRSLHMFELARLPPGYAGACGASGFGVNCPSKASIFSVPQPFGSSQKVR